MKPAAVLGKSKKHIISRTPLHTLRKLDSTSWTPGLLGSFGITNTKSSTLTHTEISKIFFMNLHTKTFTPKQIGLAEQAADETALLAPCTRDTRTWAGEWVRNGWGSGLTLLSFCVLRNTPELSSYSSVTVFTQGEDRTRALERRGLRVSQRSGDPAETGDFLTVRLRGLSRDKCSEWFPLPIIAMEDGDNST